MGFMDDAKDKASAATEEHSDMVDTGLDKGTEFADEKTGGKHSEHIDAAGDKAREGIDGLGGNHQDNK